MATELTITIRVEGSKAIPRHVADEAMKAAHEKCVVLQKPVSEDGYMTSGQMSFISTKYALTEYTS